MTLPHSDHQRVKSSDGGGSRMVQVDAVMLSVDTYAAVCKVMDAKAGQRAASVRAFISRAVEYALLSLARERAAREAEKQLEKPPLGVSER
jgi:hypothetical protein